MTEPGRTNARARILAAAAKVAIESGPGSLSLDAVAQEAGVSKGGLLYHFPSKAKLMQALVEDYIEAYERRLAAAKDDEPGGALAAYVRLFDCEKGLKPATDAWIFAAIAEDPEFLEPIRRAKARLFARLKAESPDLAATLLVFLAIEGLRSMTLFDYDLLSPADRETAIAAMTRLATRTCPEPA